MGNVDPGILLSGVAEFDDVLPGDAAVFGLGVMGREATLAPGFDGRVIGAQPIHEADGLKVFDKIEELGGKGLILVGIDVLRENEFHILNRVAGQRSFDFQNHPAIVGIHRNQGVYWALKSAGCSTPQTHLPTALHDQSVAPTGVMPLNVPQHQSPHGLGWLHPIGIGNLQRETIGLQRDGNAAVPGGTVAGFVNGPFSALFEGVGEDEFGRPVNYPGEVDSGGFRRLGKQGCTNAEEKEAEEFAHLVLGNGFGQKWGISWRYVTRSSDYYGVFFNGTPLCLRRQRCLGRF